MVNILKAFITDRMFWPENVTIRDILENLSSTGVLPRKDVLTLWSQPAFEDIMVNDRIKDYVMHVLVHLDILVEPKRYIGKDTDEYLYTRKDTAAVLDTQTENTAAAFFLVPCIVKSKIPQQMLENATDKRTICIAYHLKDTVVPSALAFKLIAASISIWPLKIVDERFCLYFQAAVMDLDKKNELQIHVEGQRIIVNLTNKESKQHISPDLATTIQECLTLALGRILQFYSRCFGKQSHQIMSDLFEIEVGEVCSGKTCLIPLSDAKKQTHWKCKNGKTHDTKSPLNWFFDKNKDQCDPNCEEKAHIRLQEVPSDDVINALTEQNLIGDCVVHFGIELGLSIVDIGRQCTSFKGFGWSNS
ncbi:unnamed protein product [Mytilus edulis]|uniref:Uncharacterized protein n=1 Tax=Mytilus edulis TaxID=6550 RepID=A0A8S3PRM9_MYTED|nr:unnamed protein product [Mytilus edulis]